LIGVIEFVSICTVYNHARGEGIFDSISMP
jgi:hypothetical protein